MPSKYNSTNNHYCPNNWQQKWVHPSEHVKTVSKVSILYRGIIISTALIFQGMEFTRAAQVVAGILIHSSIITSWSCWMLDTWCFSTFCLRMPHMCSIRFRSGDRHWPLITFSSKAVVILVVCLGCYVGKQFLKGERHHLLFPNVTVHVGIHVSLNEPQLPSTSSNHAAPDHDATTTMLDCRQGTIFLVLTRASPHMLDTIWAKQVYLRLIRPQNMVPVIHALGQVVFSKLFAGFFVGHLQERFRYRTMTMQTDLLQCVAYGLSTDKCDSTLWRATILIIKSSESSLPWGAMLNIQWSVWENCTKNKQIWTALKQDTQMCMVLSSRQKHEHDE